MYFDLALFRTRIYVHTPSTTLATFVIRDQTFRFLFFFLFFSVFLHSSLGLSCVASNLRSTARMIYRSRTNASQSFANRAQSVSRILLPNQPTTSKTSLSVCQSKLLSVFVEIQNSSNAQNTCNIQKYIKYIIQYDIWAKQICI